MAEGIAYLLDPVRASYTTGHVLEVNGGWTAWTTDPSPGLARATGTNCYACHTVYPELTQAGEDFKMHGYRFMSAADAPWTWLDSANFLAGGTPLAVRASAYYAQVNDKSLTPDGGDHNYPRVSNTFIPVGATLIAAFTLSGVSIGAYSVVATFPGYSTFTLTGNDGTLGAFGLKSLTARGRAPCCWRPAFSLRLWRSWLCGSLIRDRKGLCDNCRRYGYILRGITEPRCPECGERI